MKTSTTKSSSNSWNVDAELVSRARGGDMAAFELLVVKYQRRVAAKIRALVRRADVAEELTQEAFIYAYDNLTDLREGVMFWSWLSTIARNVASAHLRLRQHQTDAQTATRVEAAEDNGTNGGLSFAASAEQEVIAQEMFAMIDEALAVLPVKQRDALMLREIDGLDYKGIAATLGVPVNTVRSLIFRAREAIAEKIRPYMSSTRSRRW